MTRTEIAEIANWLGRFAVLGGTDADPRINYNPQPGSRMAWSAGIGEWIVKDGDRAFNMSDETFRRQYVAVGGNADDFGGLGK